MVIESAHIIVKYFLKDYAFPCGTWSPGRHKALVSLQRRALPVAVETGLKLWREEWFYRGNCCQSICL